MPPPMVSLAQGIYYFLTGIWPLLSINTFQAVTGPKTDIWLVKTVGVLVTVIGAVLAIAGLRRSVNGEITIIAAGSALGLAAVESPYAIKGRISKVYLLDAIVEIALIIAWGLGWLAKRAERA